MPVRTDEEVREALEAQAHDNANAGELLDILRWSSSGNAAQKRARLLSFLDGPASRRRAGWLDLLLQVHAAGATSFNDLEPDELEIDDEDRGGDDDARLPVGSVSVLLDLVDRLPRNAEHAPAFSVLPDLVRTFNDESGRTSFSVPDGLPSVAQLAGHGEVGGGAALQAQIERLERMVSSADARAATRLREDIRDGKLAIPADASVSSQRAAFAFDFDPDRVVLLGTERRRPEIARRRGTRSRCALVAAQGTVDRRFCPEMCTGRTSDRYRSAKSCSVPHSRPCTG